MMQLVTDRHHYLKSGNIPKAERCQIHLNFMTVLLCPLKLADIRRDIVTGKVSYRPCLHRHYVKKNRFINNLINQ